MRKVLRVSALSAVGLATAALSLGMTPAAASAAPMTPFQVEQVLFTGDPWPVSYQAFTGTTSAPGVARVTVTKLCNSFNRPLCLEYTRGAQVSWLNTATGRTGGATIRDGAAAGTAFDLATGAGVVVFRISSASAPPTIIPGFAVLRVN